VSGKSGAMTVPLDALVTMAVEVWRLNRWLASDRGSAAGSAVRYGVRRLDETLHALGVEVRDLTDQSYDAGLALEIVDALDDDALPPGERVIAEMLAPLVLHDGVVVRAGRAVIRRGTGTAAREEGR
jgi:hypothetical protein